MGKNKSIKEKMINIYGDECMIEEAGIRYIPELIDGDRQGRDETDERLEYHHIIPVKDNGPTTMENGALLKGYNHEWLHKQSLEKQAEINRRLQEYKVLMELKQAEEKVKKCKIILAELRNQGKKKEEKEK